jgi:hypothetical protein
MAARSYIASTIVAADFSVRNECAKQLRPSGLDVGWKGVFVAAGWKALLESHQWRPMGVAWNMRAVQAPDGQTDAFLKKFPGRP